MSRLNLPPIPASSGKVKQYQKFVGLRSGFNIEVGFSGGKVLSFFDLGVRNPRLEKAYPSEQVRTVATIAEFLNMLNGLKILSEGVCSVLLRKVGFEIVVEDSEWFTDSGLKLPIISYSHYGDGMSLISVNGGIEQTVNVSSLRSGYLELANTILRQSSVPLKKEDMGKLLVLSFLVDDVDPVYLGKLVGTGLSCGMMVSILKAGSFDLESLDMMKDQPESYVKDIILSTL